MDREKVVEAVFQLIPALDRCFVRPVEQKFRLFLSSMQVSVLIILKRRQETVSMSEVAAELVMSKQQLTPLIDKLVLQGFVRREADKLDRRLVRIGITAEGLQALEDIKKGTLDILADKIQVLDEQDMDKLVKLINELQKIIKKIP